MSKFDQTMALALQPDESRGADRRWSCLAGLYLLTGEGKLVRFDRDGELIAEPELSAGLSFRLRAVIDQYRSGAADDMSLALVSVTEFDQGWDAGTMVLGDRLLNESLPVEANGGAAPASRARRNRTRAVYQGMELVLSSLRDGASALPRFCPVLFVPEVNGAALRERYGVDIIDERGVFEVLDLCAAFASNSRLPDELPAMVQHMRHAQADIASASRRRRATGSAGDSASGRPARTALAVAAQRSEGSPVTEADAGFDICFSEGDAVTGWLLEWFSPFNELTDTQREIIAGYETIRTVASGSRLVEQGSTDDVCIYLVEGILELQALDGPGMRVAGGTRRSRLPISVLTPHVYTVTAVTNASVIVFSQRLIRRITEVTRTYSSVDRLPDVDVSTAAISNGMQAAYLNRATIKPSRHDL
ncbi:MAG: cyclic nucleotide-binding domain-containing protein [Arenicellales bacterium]|jgi:hypothetical protein